MTVICAGCASVRAVYAGRPHRLMPLTSDLAASGTTSVRLVWQKSRTIDLRYRSAEAAISPSIRAMSASGGGSAGLPRLMWRSVCTANTAVMAGAQSQSAQPSGRDYQKKKGKEFLRDLSRKKAEIGEARQGLIWLAQARLGEAEQGVVFTSKTGGCRTANRDRRFSTDVRSVRYREIRLR